MSALQLDLIVEALTPEDDKYKGDPRFFYYGADYEVLSHNCHSYTMALFAHVNRFNVFSDKPFAMPLNFLGANRVNFWNTDKPPCPASQHPHLLAALVDGVVSGPRGCLCGGAEAALQLIEEVGSLSS